MNTPKRSTFDRVHPRTPDRLEERDLSAAPPFVDVEGKRALFSQTSAPPAMGAVTIECSECGAESVLTPTQWIRASVPSVHLPFVKKRYPSWMRCPACRRRTWVRARFRV